MISIAICDDNIKDSITIEKNIQMYFNLINKKACIQKFFTSDDILNNKNRIDILFLNIKIDERTGIDIANKIRNEFLDEDIKIIYISYYKEYNMDIFKTRPMDFLLKPIMEQDINEALEKAIYLIEREDKVFTYKIRYDLYNENIKNILYFESLGRKTKIVTKTGEREFYGILKNIHGELYPFGFVYAHKSFLINYKYISKITPKYILINNMKIPLSRVNKENLFKIYSR